jgi:hypothetical protein
MVLAWLLGAGALSLRSLIAWVAAMRLKRSGACAAAEVWQAKLAELSARIRVSQPVTLLESCLTDVPVVIGFLRPAILVPAALFTGFPPEQLELLLIHELAHIRRHDYLVNLLQSVVEDVLFYHPAVWWVSSEWRSSYESSSAFIGRARSPAASGRSGVFREFAAGGVCDRGSGFACAVRYCRAAFPGTAVTSAPRADRSSAGRASPARSIRAGRPTA